MAWTTPTIRATGYLVTASNWNTDLVNNLAYLKGEAGVDIAFEDDITPSAGTERCGLSTARWAEGHFDKLLAGTRYTVHRYVRELCFDFDDDTFANLPLTDNTTGAGVVNMGGEGQMVLALSNAVSSTALVRTTGELNNAFDTSFNASRSPYVAIQFVISDTIDTSLELFIGLRSDNTDNALPSIAVENFIGLELVNSAWRFICGDGASGTDQQGPVTVAAGVRHVMEFLLTSATSIEVYLDGVLQGTLTTGLPTGDIEIQWLLISDGSGAGNTYLTIAKSIFQEDLS